MEIPNWVSRDYDKYSKRLIYEYEQINRNCPSFEFNIESSGHMFLQGQILTNAANVYTAAIHYPSDYPHSSPSGIVLDRDVVDYISSNKGIFLHTLGYEYGGIKLCMMMPNEWSPRFSAYTIYQRIAMWLHAFEVAKEKNFWPLPEA